MDIDFFKSAPEDQIEMLLMMQMDKLPDFFGAYNDVVSELPATEYSNTQGSGSSTNTDTNNNSNNIGGLPQVVESSSTFMHQPSTISFTGSPSVQESAELSFLRSSSNPGRWRNGGEINIPTQAQKRSSMAAMREMIFRIAAMQPIHIEPESVKPPKRRNVKISKDPQSVAARHRRERISERIRILQRLVPGGTKMDTASMLDEAIHYVKFLKNQVQSLERSAVNRPATTAAGIGFPVPMSSGSFIPMQQAIKGYQLSSAQNVQHYLDA